MLQSLNWETKKIVDADMRDLICAIAKRFRSGRYDWKEIRAILREEVFLESLKACNGCKADAARMIGISARAMGMATNGK